MFKAKRKLQECTMNTQPKSNLNEWHELCDRVDSGFCFREQDGL